MPRTAADLHIRPARLTGAGELLAITPATAGWRYCGLRVVRLDAGTPLRVATAGDELAVVPLAGAPLEARVDGAAYALRNRASVFASVPDYLYVPRGADLELRAGGPAEVALPTAPSRSDGAPCLLPAEQVAIEVRGAGRATRQVTNFLTPDVAGPDRLCCCEVLTPPGNWSSHPPHKHDDASNGIEAELEEIYYFRIDGEDGFGAHRTYDLVEGWDVTVAVESDDAFLVPRGYHGPCMASPEHALWYLNVLAGPGAVRSMAISDDPAHAWVRGTWERLEPDARVPLATA